MCREREVDRELGGTDIDTLPSVQPPRVKGPVAASRSSKPPNQVLAVKVIGSPNSVKEDQERVVNEREGVRPVLSHRISAQSPRLLPYFPKPGVTSPPPPQSLARLDLSTRDTAESPLSSEPQSKAAQSPLRANPRTPSSTPSSSKSAQQAASSSRSALKASTARNPSPAPAVRAAARSPSPNPTTTRPCSPVSRSSARNPSPTPAPRTNLRNPPQTPAAARSTARTPSPGPARSASPILASRVAPRSASPGPALKPSTSVGTRSPASVIVNPLAPSSNNKCTPRSASPALDNRCVRRSASPALVKRDLVPSNNGNKISTEESLRKLALVPVEPNPTSLSIRPAPRSTLDVSSSLKNDGAVQLPAESLTSFVKKPTAVELQALKKERIAGYGRKQGASKSGRVACEGMLPTSPSVPIEPKKRCQWVTAQSEPGLIQYHDEVWGVPVHDDKLLFELLVLEGAQAELSRPQILSMRDYFREVLGAFDPEIVATFDEKKVTALMVDEFIRQPEAKLRGVIENAKQVLKIVQEFGSFQKYLWSFVGFKPIVNAPRSFTQIPVKSSKSETLSKDLMRRGFRYVGPTTVYSFMQAAGMVNDHLVSCYRSSECCAIAEMQGRDSSNNGDKRRC